MLISDFAEPLQLTKKSGGGASAFVPNEDAVAMVMAMGFNRDQAIKALKNTVSNNTSP